MNMNLACLFSEYMMPRYLSVCQNSLAQQSCLNTNSPETIKARTTSWHIHLRTEKPHVYHKKICTRLKEGPRSIDWRVCSACLTLCDPVDCSPPGSSVHGILQATALEWVAVHFSRGSSWPRDRTQVSCIAGGFFLAAETPGEPTLKSVIYHIFYHIKCW